MMIEKANSNANKINSQTRTKDSWILFSDIESIFRDKKNIYIVKKVSQNWKLNYFLQNKETEKFVVDKTTKLQKQGA